MNLARLKKLNPIRFVNRYSFSTHPMPSIGLDVANMAAYQSIKDYSYLTISAKFGQFGLMSLYESLDKLSREFLFLLSDDFGLGMSGAIITTTILVKLIYIFPVYFGQKQGLLQDEIGTITKKYQEKLKIARMTRNKELQREARYSFKLQCLKRGFFASRGLLMFSQAPILLTWFLSLRYMSNLTEVYPQMLSGGLLWFKDLSCYDPYFILPLLAATTTFYSIMTSPPMSKNIPQVIQLIFPYLKYLPFVSLTFSATFPASITLYWTVLSFCQIGQNLILRHPSIIRMMKNKSVTNLKSETVFVITSENSRERPEDTPKVAENSNSQPVSEHSQKMRVVPLSFTPLSHKAKKVKANKEQGKQQPQGK